MFTDALSPQEPIDIFICYKQRRFSQTAEILPDFLARLEVRTWLDQNEIERNKILPREELKKIIKVAVMNSRLVVFFETYDTVEINNISL